MSHPMAHCVAACEINRCLGGTYTEAVTIGGLLEEWQWIFPENGWFGWGTGGWFENPWWDEAAYWNHLGAALADECPRRSCEEACRIGTNDAPGLR